MFLTLTNRETVGLCFMFYVNYLVYQCYFFGNHCTDSIYHHTAIYSVIDSIWIYMEPCSNSKVPNHEMYIHHFCCFLLVFSNTPFMEKLGLLLIEFTSLLLMTLKLPLPQQIRYALKKVLATSWVILRLIWSPINFHLLKVSNMLSGRLIYPPEYVAYNVIYLLNIKWSLQVARVLNNTRHYSSIFLSLPVMYTRIPLTQFHAVNLLTYTSYVNHSVKNRLTNSLDEFAISNCSLVYFDVPCYFSIPISALIAWFKYKRNISVFTQIIYSLSLAYNCVYVPYVVYTLPAIFYGFYDMQMGSRNTSVWHLSNGIYIYLTSIDRY